eukprot:TRINITY_DN730_c0_g1_i1.p1 TRINITY_DN730_c0_g1~~TRINITY_DN730_c0_g1_i1.p1  ORF type:complete len:220 (-),score=46.38 TRINITY_DN730_c0_g1_i1:25-684(-)
MQGKERFQFVIPNFQAQEETPTFDILDNLHAAFLVIAAVATIICGACFLIDFDAMVTWFKAGNFGVGLFVLLLGLIKHLINFWWFFMLYHECVKIIPFNYMKEVSLWGCIGAGAFLLLGLVIQFYGIYSETKSWVDTLMHPFIIEFLAMVIADVVAIFIAMGMKNPFPNYLIYMPAQQQEFPAESLKANRVFYAINNPCLLYTSPSPRDQRGSRMPSSA